MKHIRRTVQTISIVLAIALLGSCILILDDDDNDLFPRLAIDQTYSSQKIGGNQTNLYSFVATATAHNVSVFSMVNVDADWYLYDDPNQALNSLSPVDQSVTAEDPEDDVVTGLTVGVTYYLRVTNDTSKEGTYSIRVN